MEQVGDLKLYSFEEIEDRHLGKIGTPRRDAYEKRLKEELEAYHVGEAIRKARQAQNLTQAQLGERIGVQKSQISKLEKGRSITLSSMIRVFKALGVPPATIDLGSMGKLALW